MEWANRLLRKLSPRPDGGQRKEGDGWLKIISMPHYHRLYKQIGIATATLTQPTITAFQNHCYIAHYHSLSKLIRSPLSQPFKVSSAAHDHNPSKCHCYAAHNHSPSKLLLRSPPPQPGVSIIMQPSITTFQSHSYAAHYHSFSKSLLCSPTAAHNHNLLKSLLCQNVKPTVTVRSYTFIIICSITSHNWT